MKSFAAFDIDGTLIRWQLYHAVVDRLAKKNLLGNGAKEQLHTARMRWKEREHPEAFRDYQHKLISIYTEALPVLDPTQFDHAVQEIVQEYANQVYTYTRDLAKQLKHEGYMLLAISGSHHELVEQIARQYGFDDWQGSVYSRAGGRFTGKVTVASDDKKSQLEHMIKTHSLSLENSYAVGDSKSDAPMLKMVEHPIAFNPDQQLYALAIQHKWPIVIERKNVVYKLTPEDSHNGAKTESYILE